MPLPFFAPLFGLLLTATPAPPLRLKGLVGLLLMVTITLGVGLVMTPLLRSYPFSAVLIIAAGLYASTVIAVGLRKALVGTLLSAGFTLIPAVGLVEYAAAVTLIHAFLIGIGIAIASQAIVYPFFPEDPGKKTVQERAAVDVSQTRRIALRSALIVLPPVMAALSNPSMYLPVIMKSVLLTQQAGVVDVRTAGRQMLGATLLGGLYAALFWFALKTWPSLWMFFLLMLLFGIYFAGKLYGVIAGRYPPFFWQDVVINLLILLGPAVEDSANGKDPYHAFAVRFSLFIAVALYAWAAIAVLEWMRGHGPSARLHPAGSI